MTAPVSHTPDEQSDEAVVKSAVDTLDASAFEPFIRKAADEIYDRIYSTVEDYLTSNAQFNIECRLYALRREIERVQEAKAELLEALRGNITAVDDWLHTYAHDLCNGTDVKESQHRILSEGGTLSYIARLQQANRAAIAKATQP